MTTTEERQRQVRTRDVRPKVSWMDRPTPAWIIVVVVLLITIAGAGIATAVLIGGLKSALNTAFTGGTTTQNSAQPSFAPNKNWHPAASDANYCTVRASINTVASEAPLSAYGASLLANFAPTGESHNAALALYRVANAHRSTTAALAAVNASYNCPATATSQAIP